MVLLLFPVGALAGAVDSGAYTVRYSAINSLQIPAAVAAENGISRDGHRAVITITLQHPTRHDPYHAVPAKVTGHAKTLIGAPQQLDFRRVDSGQSVYSIAVLQLDNARQTVTVTLEVTTLDGSALIPVRFTERLYSRQR